MSIHKSKLSALSVAIVASTVAANASAEEETTDVVVEEPAAETAVSFSGFVDASLFVPLAGYADDGDEVLLGLDQVEVDIEAQPHDDLLIRTDINFFPAAGVPTFDSLVEQGFFDYSFGGGGFFQVGKRNAPVGAEAIDPVDMYQYSYGQLFVNATPSNLTGFFGGYRGDAFGAMVWVTNDWDLSTTPRSATPGLRLSYAFDSGAVGLSSTYGPVVSDDPYLMVDVDAAFGFGDLTLLAEANVGTSDAISSVGALVTANYAVSDTFSATLRADYLNREVGEEEIDQVSLTLAGLLAIADNYGALAELRADLPSGADPVITGAVEFTAFW